jgi:hypothetical protein
VIGIDDFARKSIKPRTVLDHLFVSIAAPGSHPIHAECDTETPAFQVSARSTSISLNSLSSHAIDRLRDRSYDAADSNCSTCYNQRYAFSESAARRAARLTGSLAMRTGEMSLVAEQLVVGGPLWNLHS